MNEHQHDILSFSALVSSLTTLFAGLSLQEWFGILGIFGMIVTTIIQVRRDRRESEFHNARMEQLKVEHQTNE